MLRRELILKLRRNKLAKCNTISEKIVYQYKLLTKLLESIGIKEVITTNYNDYINKVAKILKEKEYLELDELFKNSIIIVIKNKYSNEQSTENELETLLYFYRVLTNMYYNKQNKIKRILNKFIFNIY